MAFKVGWRIDDGDADVCQNIWHVCQLIKIIVLVSIEAMNFLSDLKISLANDFRLKFKRLRLTIKLEPCST